MTQINKPQNKYRPLNPEKGKHRAIISSLKAIYRNDPYSSKVWDNKELIEEIKSRFKIPTYMGVWVWLEENRHHYIKTKK